MDTITSLILNYNDAETTLNLIRRIENYELYNHIVIVDNCSTDDSLKRLQPIQSDRVIVIKSDKNGGYGYGNNFGIRYAHKALKSKFILISNPDVEYSEETIISMYNVLKNNSEVSAVSTIALKPDGSRQHNTGWRLPSVTSYTLSASIILSKVFRIGQYPKDYFKGEGIREVECVPGSLLMVRTADMVDFGMYDENMFLYCEETTLGNRLKAHGRKTLILLDESYIHHHSVSINKSISGVLKQRKIMYDSKYKFIESYLTDNKIKLFLVRIFMKIALLENSIIFKLKGV